jgi:heme exporter protein D
VIVFCVVLTVSFVLIAVCLNGVMPVIQHTTVLSQVTAAGNAEGERK